MNIFYCGDKNITDGLIISIISLTRNVKESLNIYVLTVSIHTDKKDYEAMADSVIEVIDKLVKESEYGGFVKKIDITDIMMKELPTANMNTRFTPCCMLRLYADQVEELPDKILYLDNDVICRGDVSDLFDQNIEDYEFTGTLDYYGKWFFRRHFYRKDYMNSGVLLMNMKKIKETRLLEKCRKMCTEKEMFMPDQSALNKLSAHKKVEPRKFNEQRRLRRDTVIQHFTTSFRLFPWLHTLTVKPWQIEAMHSKLRLYEYDDILEEYQKVIEQLK